MPLNVQEKSLNALKNMGLKINKNMKHKTIFYFIDLYTLKRADYLDNGNYLISILNENQSNWVVVAQYTPLQLIKDITIVDSGVITIYKDMVDIPQTYLYYTDKMCVFTFNELNELFTNGSN